MPTTKKPTTAKELSAWEMSRSILSGLEQARNKAREEHAEIVAEHYGQPFKGRNMLTLFEGLDEAFKALDADMRQIARANNWEL